RPLVGELHTVAALVLAGEQLGGDRLDVPGGHRVAPGVRFIVLPCPCLAESWLANSAVTLPRPAKVAVKTSPGATGTMLVTEPGRTTWPASSRVPRTPTVLASHTRLVSGEPSTAPPAPVPTIWELRLSTQPRRRRSSASSGVGVEPRTKPPELALSAMVSPMVIFQSAMRLSTISRAGRT